MRLEQLDLAEWRDALPGTGYEAFHTPAALRVLDEHTDATMRLSGVFKGQEPVGLLPAFVESSPLGQVVTSPPSSMGVPRLGPLVMPTSPKQRKREAVNRDFVDLVLEQYDFDSPWSLLQFDCPLAYEDPRPFQWSGLDVGQEFTYVLDLSSTTLADVRDRTGPPLREEIRESETADVTVSDEGADAAPLVFGDIADWHARRGDTPPVGREFFCDLVSTLEDRSHVYVARDENDEYLGGLVVLAAGSVASCWQGGLPATHDGVDVSVALHWAVVSDIVSGDGPAVSAYDFGGSGLPVFSRYESQFGADLVPYFTVESSGLPTAVAKRARSLVHM